MFFAIFDQTEQYWAIIVFGDDSKTEINKNENKFFFEKKILKICSFYNKSIFSNLTLTYRSVNGLTINEPM